MGLRERASDYSKAVGASRGIDLNLELRPEQGPMQKPTQSASPKLDNDLPATPVVNPPPENRTEPGHKSQLDAVLNLIEIYKEFGQVKKASELWQIVAYSLMAQLGTKYIAIFMEDDTRMELKHALGFTLASDYSFAAKSKLCERLRSDKKILHIDDLKSSLAAKEEEFLITLGARYAVPVFRYEELRGVILINPPLGSAALKTDDLFYLKICGEILGAMEAQLELVANAETRNQKFIDRERYAGYATEFFERLGKLDNDEPLIGALEDALSRFFPETALLLLLREDFFLRRHYSTGFARDKVEHLEVDLVDSIVEKIKSGQETLSSSDLESSEAFAFLARYRQVSAHRVLHRQEILAVALIADSESDRVAALKSMVSHYILQNHISRLRDHATGVLKHADNPVVAIRNFIAACEEHLTNADEPFAVIVTDLTNYNRLHNLHGDGFAEEIRDFTRKTLREIMEAQDFSTEAFHGHFVSVLRQKEAGDAWRLSRMLQKQAGKSYADEDRRPIFQHKIYARPHIQAIPFEMLFKA